MNDHIHEEHTDSTKLSAFKIYKFILKELGAIKTYPLTPDNLHVQRDAFTRLADSDDDADGNDEIFAVIDNNQRERDESFRFSLSLASNVFSLDVEGVGNWLLPYAAVASSEQEVAKQLRIAIQMLSSGQLFALHTTSGGRLRAVETLYRKTPHESPRLISIDYADYPPSLKRDKRSRYDTHVFRNHYALDYIDLPDNFFLLPKMPDGSLSTMVRDFPGGTLTPLTKKAHAVIMNDLQNKMAGAKDDDDLGKKILGSWEYWAMSLVFFAALRLVWPDLPLTLSALATMLASTFIAGLALLPLFRLKQRLRATQPDHIYLRVNEVVRYALRDLWSIWWANRLLLVVAVGSLLLPVYITTKDHALVSFAQLITGGVPIAAVAALGLVGALVLSFSKDYVRQALGMLLALLSTLGIIAINFLFTYTGEDIATPEPQTTIALATYVTYIIFVVYVLFKTYVLTRLRKSKG